MVNYIFVKGMKARKVEVSLRVLGKLKVEYKRLYIGM